MDLIERYLAAVGRHLPAKLGPLVLHLRKDVLGQLFHDVGLLCSGQEGLHCL